MKKIKSIISDSEFQVVAVGLGFMVIVLIIISL
nr:MAG TPA: hypothetical protein [Caudoviricetes sp.]